MSQKLYWARPITTYSRTHKEALQNHIDGKAVLSEAEQNLHVSLLNFCHKFETAVHDRFHYLGYEVVDPGSEKVANDFEAWRNLSDEHKANPMPFFTELAEPCDGIAFSCFNDLLNSEGAPDVINRIGCGVVAEVNAWVHKQSADGAKAVHVTSLNWDFNQNDLVADFVVWTLENADAEVLCQQNFEFISSGGEKFTCLNYPQTKALLLMQGYKSRSSKHKKK